MGYESKLYIVDRYVLTFGENMQTILGDVLAQYNLAAMGDEEFYNLFQTPIDFSLYNNYTYLGEQDNKDIYTWNEEKSRYDRYGKICNYASLNDVITYLEDYMTFKEHYRRIFPLLCMLKGFKKEAEENNSWENLIVVHYGH